MIGDGSVSPVEKRQRSFPVVRSRTWKSPGTIVVTSRLREPGRRRAWRRSSSPSAASRGRVRPASRSHTEALERVHVGDALPDGGRELDERPDAPAPDRPERGPQRDRRDGPASARAWRRRRATGASRGRSGPCSGAARRTGAGSASWRTPARRPRPGASPRRASGTRASPAASDSPASRPTVTDAPSTLVFSRRRRR